MAVGCAAACNSAVNVSEAVTSYSLLGLLCLRGLLLEAALCPPSTAAEEQEEELVFVAGIEVCFAKAVPNLTVCSVEELEGVKGGKKKK